MENPDRKYRWDIALTSINDRVFPSSNLINYWKGREDTVHITTELPHYPFYHWKTFDNMIKNLLKKSGLDFTY
jgi:biotin synthesis protein BioG